MSKPMIVTLPFVLLLLDFWPLGRLRSIFHLAILYPHPGMLPFWKVARGISAACVYIPDGTLGYEISSMVYCWMALVHGNTCACNRNCTGRFAGYGG